MPLARDPLLHPREVVVVEPEAPAHRLAVGEVEHLRRGQPLARRARAAARRRRGSGWSGAASGRRAARAGRAGAARRAAPRARRRSATSPAPNVAWISGANVSMSGHITITSRGSSVGSSASRCRIASRRTSTWRARPWQEWTCTLRSSGVAGGAASGGAVRAHVGLDAREQRVRRGARPGGGGRRGSPAPASTSCSSRDVLAPGGEQPVGGQRRGRVVARAGRPAAARGRAATRSHSARRRVQQRTVDVARGGERAQHVEVAGGQPREAEQRDPRRAGRRAPARSRRRAHAPASRSAGPASRSASRRRRHSSACQRGVGRDAGVVAGRPRADHLGPVQRVAVEQVGEVADGREAPRPPSASARRPGARPARAATAPPGTRRRPRAAARPPARAATGRRRGRSRTPPRPRRRRAGAATGSRRSRRRRRAAPAARAEPADSRCVSQRSMPRVGTATTSGANGSASGSASSARERLDQPVGPFGSVDVEHVANGCGASTPASPPPRSRVRARSATTRRRTRSRGRRPAAAASAR